MVRQFTFVKRFAGQDHPFRDFTSAHGSEDDTLRAISPEVSLGKQPEAEVAKENFLTLYCLQEDC